MDFTLNTYHHLLNALYAEGFKFQSFSIFMQTPVARSIVLRHDVDRLPINALKTARLESDLGISASYYFRAVSESWDEAIISEISKLGHEVGYHYENLSFCNGRTSLAWENFQTNLAKLRALVPVTSICMHGSPMSHINNLDLWQTYDYKTLGVVGEPYLDVDYSEVFYLSDTGRSWNHSRASIRDKVDSGFSIPVSSTGHLIDLARQGQLPDQIMINTHPQRWEDRPLHWLKELVWQNVKNRVKWALFKLRS